MTILSNHGAYFSCVRLDLLKHDLGGGAYVTLQALSHLFSRIANTNRDLREVFSFVCKVGNANRRNCNRHCNDDLVLV